MSSDEKVKFSNNPHGFSEIIKTPSRGLPTYLEIQNNVSLILVHLFIFNYSFAHFFFIHSLRKQNTMRT